MATYPVQIQADNEDANDSQAPCMCHVFDIKAGNQDLVTVQSSNMERLLARSKSLLPMSNLANTVMSPPSEVQNVP